MNVWAPIQECKEYCFVAPDEAEEGGWGQRRGPKNNTHHTDATIQIHGGSPFDDVPGEVLEFILASTGEPSILVCRFVNRLWHEMSAGGTS